MWSHLACSLLLRTTRNHRNHSFVFSFCFCFCFKQIDIYTVNIQISSTYFQKGIPQWLKLIVDSRPRCYLPSGRLYVSSEKALDLTSATPTPRIPSSSLPGQMPVIPRFSNTYQATLLYIRRHVSFSLPPPGKKCSCLPLLPSVPG